jgi:hypothetical protein
MEPSATFTALLQPSLLTVCIDLGILDRFCRASMYVAVEDDDDDEDNDDSKETVRWNGGMIGNRNLLFRSSQ